MKYEFKNRSIIGVFDSKSSQWSKDINQCKFFIDATQRYANDKLQHEKILFLNDVYSMLGMPRTRIGALLGWFIKHGEKHAEIDFHAKVMNNAILLVFSCDGNAFEYLPESNYEDPNVAKVPTVTSDLFSPNEDYERIKEILKHIRREYEAEDDTEMSNAALIEMIIKEWKSFERVIDKIETLVHSV